MATASATSGRRVALRRSSSASAASGSASTTRGSPHTMVATIPGSCFTTSLAKRRVHALVAPDGLPAMLATKLTAARRHSVGVSDGSRARSICSCRREIHRRQEAACDCCVAPDQGLAVVQKQLADRTDQVAAEQVARQACRRAGRAGRLRAPRARAAWQQAAARAARPRWDVRPSVRQARAAQPENRPTRRHRRWYPPAGPTPSPTRARMVAASSGLPEPSAMRAATAAKVDAVPSYKRENTRRPSSRRCAPGGSAMVSSYRATTAELGAIQSRSSANRCSSAMLNGVRAS